MSNKITFTVTPRTIIGKKVKQLRRGGLIPANIYGAGEDSVAVQCVLGEFRRLYDRVGETSVVYLQLEGTDQQKPVLISTVEVDPLTNDVLHVDFKQVNLREKIEAEVPVEVIGEFKVPGAVLVTVLDHVTVEALPTDLPEKFEVDSSVLTEIGQTVTFGDLQFDKNKVVLVGIASAEDLEQPILIAQEQKEEVVDEEAAAEEAETAEAPAAETTEPAAE